MTPYDSVSLSLLVTTKLLLLDLLCVSGHLEVRRYPQEGPMYGFCNEANVLLEHVSTVSVQPYRSYESRRMLLLSGLLPHLSSTHLGLLVPVELLPPIKSFDAFQL